MAPTSRWQRGLATLSPLLYALPLALAAALVDHIVPEPYLDEIFHIPQAAAYCEGRWDVWDPKLTTPPGVYLVYVALHRVLLGPVFGMACYHPAAMRSVNALALLVVARVLQELIGAVRGQAEADKDGGGGASSPPSYAHVVNGASASGISLPRTLTAETALRRAIEDPTSSARDARLSLHQAERRRQSPTGTYALEAHVVAFLPPLWFFGLLFYTDVCSLLSVLVCMLFARRGRHGLASVTGLASLWFRQTNIVWVVFILATSLVDNLRPYGLQDGPASDLSASTLLTTLRTALSALSHRPAQSSTARLLATYAPVLLAFAAFLRWNAGIVLGDKTNHVAVAHVPQVLYFAAFGVVFGWAALVRAAGGSSVVRLLGRTGRALFGGPGAVVTTLFWTGAALLAIERYTVEHPFLLADNRHYAFYVWRRVVKAHRYARYALAPVYVVSGRIMWDGVARTQTALWTLGFALALALTLIPSPLIEPRYFLVPYIIWRAHLVSGGTGGTRGTSSPSTSTRARSGRRGAQGKWLAVEAAWYALINLLTLSVFLFKPFKWPGEEGWQRFMW